MKRIYTIPKMEFEKFVPDTNILSAPLVGCYLCLTDESAITAPNEAYPIDVTSDYQADIIVPAGSEITWTCNGSYGNEVACDYIGPKTQ